MSGPVATMFTVVIIGACLGVLWSVFVKGHGPRHPLPHVLLTVEFGAVALGSWLKHAHAGTFIFGPLAVISAVAAVWNWWHRRRRDRHPAGHGIGYKLRAILAKIGARMRRVKPRPRLIPQPQGASA